MQLAKARLTGRVHRSIEVAPRVYLRNNRRIVDARQRPSTRAYRGVRWAPGDAVAAYLGWLRFVEATQENRSSWTLGPELASGGAGPTPLEAVMWLSSNPPEGSTSPALARPGADLPRARRCRVGDTDHGGGDRDAGPHQEHRQRRRHLPKIRNDAVAAVNAHSICRVVGRDMAR